MKNGLIGAAVAGALIIGGHAFLSNDSNSTVNIFPSNDKDCSDFPTRGEAQAFFLEQGGPASDPHRLDNDGDGRVCETLP